MDGSPPDLGLSQAYPTLSVDDGTTAPEPPYLRWVAPLLNDRRDATFVGLMCSCSLAASTGVVLFFVDRWFWYLAPIHLLLVALLIDRFTLMLHCTSHRPLFKPKFQRLNLLIPWLLGPFFGQTPETYFAHHLGMHHPEANLDGDLSSTQRFQRDKLGHFLRYLGRFLGLILLDMSLYLGRRKRMKLLRRVLLGEGVYWSAVIGLALLRPYSVLVVLAIPFLAIRSLMMVGNWGQHAFVCDKDPANPYRSSITCINSRYNRRCFNDGYHIGHHVNSRAHFTEYPAEFAQNLDRYGQNDSIVFQGVDFFQVWLFLMLGRWSRLAQAFVQLPSAPTRGHDEIVALLKARVRPVLSPPTSPSVSEIGLSP
jgi:fatty acid desaturase